MNNVRAIQKLNELELKMGVSASWHDEFKHSAYIAVTGLPFDLTEGDVRVVFSQYGKVVDVNLIRDKTTGKSRGFGFLAYEDQRSTVLAVDNFNGAQLLGRTLRVDHCKDYKPPKKDEKGKDAVKEGADAPGEWKHDRFDPRSDRAEGRDRNRSVRIDERGRSDRPTGRDISPPRRAANSSQPADASPRARRSPPRGEARGRASDLSPPRRGIADLSPPRRDADRRDAGGRQGNADQSPPRRRRSPSPRSDRDKKPRSGSSPTSRRYSPPSSRSPPRSSARSPSPASRPPRRRSPPRSPPRSQHSLSPSRRGHRSPSPSSRRNRSRSPPKR